MIVHHHDPRLHLGAPTLAADLWGGSHGAITGRRKLHWRYRWPDSVRDDVLARLLALNAERYQEEVNLGLHGGGRRGGGASSGGSGTGRRRGRPPKTPPTGSDQIGHSL